MRRAWRSWLARRSHNTTNMIGYEAEIPGDILRSPVRAWLPARSDAAVRNFLHAVITCFFIFVRPMLT